MPEDRHRPAFQGRQYAAFLFDMDGTLLNSTVAVERAWRAWAARVGIDGDTLLASIHGMRTEDTVRKFGPSQIDVAAEVAFVLNAELGDVSGVVPIDGAVEFLAQLPADRWAVVTSASRSLAEKRMRAVGLPLPAIMVSADDVQRGKPDPEGFLKAAALLGAPIGDCLVFEDSAPGVAAAKAAGASVVVVGDALPEHDAAMRIHHYLF